MKRLAYELRKEAEGLESMARTNPDSYFVEAWIESAKVLRKDMEALHREEQALIEGKSYNTFLDTWE